MIFGYNGPSHLRLPISTHAGLHKKACSHPHCPPVRACGLTPPCHSEPHRPLHKPGSELRAQRRACRADVGSVALAGLVTCSHQLLGPWTAALQASITNSQSLLKLMSIESVMPSNHLILCCPFLLLPSIFPSIRAFQMSVLCIRWPKYCILCIVCSKYSEP